MESSATTHEQPPTTEKASRWEDFIDVFTSPGDVFRRRANDSWAVPMIVVAVGAIVLFYGFLGVNRAFNEADMATFMAKRPEMAEAMRQRGGASGRGVVFGGIVIPIVLTLTVLVSAGFLWIVSKLTSIQLTFRRSLMISAFVRVIMLVQMLVINVMALLKVNRGEPLDGIRDRSTGALRFMDVANTNDAVAALVGRVDLFAIWMLVLTAIGLHAAAGAPKDRAYATAAIVWFAGAVPTLFFLMFS